MNEDSGRVTPTPDDQTAVGDQTTTEDQADLWRPTIALRRTWPRSGVKGELFEFALSGYPHARDFFPSLLEPEKPSGRFLKRMLSLGFHAHES